jgi:transposase-like protein
MADEMRIGLAQLLRKAQVQGDADFLKEGVRALSQALMEMEVEQHIGASLATSGPRDARGSATVTGKGPGRRGRARSSLRCPG